MGEKNVQGGVYTVLAWPGWPERDGDSRDYFGVARAEEKIEYIVTVWRIRRVYGKFTVTLCIPAGTFT